MLMCPGHLSNSPAHGCGTVETPAVSQASVSERPLEGDVPAGKCMRSMWSLLSSLGKGTVYFLRKLFPQWPEFPGRSSKAAVRSTALAPVPG